MIDIERLSESVPDGDGYIGQDGLLHCKKCGGALETIITVPMIGKRKVRCICECVSKKLKEREEEKRQAENERNRRICFNGSKLMNCTFNNSVQTEHLEMAKNYVKHFEEFKKQGKGLILHGTVGTGKSHIAACIANALIDKGQKVLMTNFATMVNTLQSTFDGRQEYIDSLNRYALLIIDDLGTERRSEYMQEQVFNIIDSRYRSGLPMIITTNLTGDEITKTDDIGNSRIYDRILEKCQPIKVSGQSIRRKKLKVEYGQTEMILKGEV